MLAYATYLGNPRNRINALALGSDGSMYVAGVTLASAAAVDAAQASSGEGTAFVAHVSSDGSTVLYFSNLGAGTADEARAIAVDLAGNAYVTGETRSRNFPTVNALQAACSQNAAGVCAGDAFVVKLNAQGAIVYSTYLGGSGEDAGNAIAVDASGNAYVAGATSSTDFPTMHAAQTSGGGGVDAFVAKISADGSRVVFATYIGGTGDDEARGIAVDAAGNIFVAGRTASPDFPVHNALQSSCELNANGACAGEAFVAKIAADGASFVYSTYLGGSGGDAANAIAVDASGDAYVTGVTNSADFPVVKALATRSGGGGDAFVSRLAADGRSLVFSTYLGGSGADQANAIALNSNGDAIVSGSTGSPNFPAFNAIQASCTADGDGGCSTDSFVAALDAAGSTIEFATYLGGSGIDVGRGVAVDGQGAIYLAGATSSVNFPGAKLAQLPNTAAGAAASESAGGAFAAKITGVSLGAGAGAGSAAGGGPKSNQSQLPDPPTACTGTTTNWLGGTGNWSNGAMWSTGVAPNSSGTNVCIDDGNGATSVVTLDINVSVGTLTIDSGDSLIIGDGQAFTVAGNISNAGAIQVNSATNNTLLEISGSVTLSGGGTLTLAESGTHTALINEASANSTLTNFDNTIQGVGQIGNNGLVLVNQPGGIINANAGGALLLNPNHITNQGLIEGTGGTLEINVATNNSGGTISASGGTGSVQFLGGATIQGGSVATSGGGVLGTATGNGTTLDGNSQGMLTIAGTYTGADNSTTVLTGTINNTGNILVNSAANNTLLQMSGPVTLTGAGTLTLAESGAHTAVINEASANSTLTNFNNTIQGVGQIGNNGLVLVNQAAGIVDANSNGAALLLNPNGITNLGSLEATNGGVLQTTTVVNNQGATIKAVGANSTVQFLSGTTVQGGALSTQNGGTLGVASGNGATLDGAVHGTLTNAGTYTGADNSTTILVGTITNTGLILINSVANNTLLQVSGGVTLTGAGTLTLAATGSSIPVVNESSSNSTLTNMNNVIQGVGQIGNNGMVLVNQAAGIVDANITGAGLLLNSNGITNQGQLEATNGGILRTSTTINNLNATITASGAGSTVQFLNGTTVQGGTLTTSGGGILGVAVGNGTTLNGTAQGTLTIAGTYTAADNSTTVLVGTINNTGTIAVNSVANNVLLQVSGMVNLMGPGTVTMTAAGAQIPLINESSANSTLVNVSNTIQGVGQIGNNGMALKNQGTINASQAGGTLLINPSGTINSGFLEASAGTLQLANSVINNSAGTIEVTGAGSTVQFVSGATIQGGTLMTAGTGVLGVAAGNGITLDGNALGPLKIVGTYTGADNSTTVLAGTINNTGVILLNSVANNVLLEVTGAVTLAGGGTVTMSASGGHLPIINESSSSSSLTNSNNKIQGVGQIGNNGMVFINQAPGIVNANVAGGALLLNPNGVTNQGLLEATNGGILQTSTAVNNLNATITASGANSTVQFLGGTTIQGGTLSTLSGGILGVPIGTGATLDGTAHGALTNAGTYTGPDNSTTVLVGTINNTGQMQFTAAANNVLLEANGAVSLTGPGTVTLAASGTGTPVINESSANSTLTNVGNTIQGVGQIGNNGLVLVNQGTIEATAARALILNPNSITNQGLLESAPGATLQLTDGAIANTGGTIKIDGAMSVPAAFIVNGGTLSGAGTIQGNVTTGTSAITQPGDIPLPGVLTFAGSGGGLGNFTQGPTETFTVVIGGTAPGTQYSQLNLAGAASLNGAFSVSLANGFAPPAGTQFTVINAASVAGQFSSSNLPNLPPGLAWSVIYNPTSVVLVAAAPASIAVTPTNPSIAVNATLQFTATATLAGGGTQDITNAVTWASGTPAFATINPTGLATGVATGTTSISATLGNVVGSTNLTVTASTTPSLTQVSPNTGGQGVQNLSVAITGQATHFAQGSTVASFGAGITVASLTINSATSATAVINIDQAAALGARTVTLTTGNEIAPLMNGFTVTALTLQSIAVTPNPAPAVAVGATEQFTATGTFSDNSTQNLTNSATWNSSAPGFATISNAAGTRGLATGVAAGPTTITAAMSGVTSPGVSLTVTAAGPTLTSITVAPPTASIAVNATEPFAATGHFSDGSSGSVTVNWGSANNAIATVNAAGVATGVAAGGPIAITATSTQTPSVSGSAQLTVTAAPPTLTSITVAPPTASIAVNATQPFTATGHFSDGSSGSVTVNWGSANNAIATVNAAGVATGVSAGGPIAITATSTQTPSVSGSAQLTVTAAPPTLISITVAPPTASIAVNATQPFTATGHFSDGSSGSVTVNWSSANNAIATVNGTGVATGVSAGGPVAITATSTQTPSVSGAAQLTVTAAPPTLLSITVAPPTASIAINATQPFAATGHFSDGSSSAVSVNWGSSNNAVATIDASGVATGVSPGGPITITATSTQTPSVKGTAQLTVTAAALISIAVTPANPSGPAGATQRFQATGTYADTTMKDITSTVVWASSNHEAATIDVAGLASLVAPGQSTVSATLGNVSGNTMLTVTNAPFSLTIAPPAPGQPPGPPVVAPGGTVAFGLILTPVPGFNGTVQFACTTTNPTVTCAPDPNSVALTPNSPNQVAIVINTFCQGTTQGASPVSAPGGPLAPGLMLLVMSLILGAAAWSYQRRQAWVLSFAALVLIALGSAACSSLPKGPNGPTQGGPVTVTVTATANGVTVTAPPLEMIVE
ncbi:MAG: Ig-like domain-containing protein [Candidatus Acidiferrales bacterium]